MTPTPAAPALRRLAPLTLLVLLAHLAVLRTAPHTVLQPGARTVQTFSTRTIVPAPPPAAVAVGPQAPAPQPAPAPRRQHVPPPPPPAHDVMAAVPTAPPIQEPPNPTPTDMESGGAAMQPPSPAQAAAESTSSTMPPPPGSAQAIPNVLALPVPARLRYEVTASRMGLSLQGEADLLWRHDGRQYEAQLEVRSAVGSRVERSTGRITEEGLAPDYYAQKSRGEQATHFQRDKGLLTFSNNRPSSPLLAGTQDRLSVIVQLAALIGGEPARYPPGTQIVIPTTSTSEAENWIFSVEGEEELQLPGGTLRALKLQRRPRKEYDQKVELWLAPRLDYAPVRLRLTNPNGDTVDQRWSSTDKG